MRRGIPKLRQLGEAATLRALQDVVLVCCSIHRVMPHFDLRILVNENRLRSLRWCVLLSVAACSTDLEPAPSPRAAALNRVSDHAWEDGSSPLRQFSARLAIKVPADGRAGFLHVADIAENASGNIAVLDRQEKRVFLFDSEWTQVGSFGGAGEGPAEFKDPVAIEALGNAWIVWDRALMRLSLFEASGSHRITRSVPVIGDLANAIYRQPTFGFYAPFPGNVSLTQRLQSLDAAGFAMYVEDNEWDAPARDREGARNAHLLRYSADLELVDTLYAGAGVDIVLERPASGAGLVARAPATFSPHVVWSSGPNGAVLLSDGSPEVRVLADSATYVIKTRLHSREVTDEDKREIVEWSYQRWSPFWRSSSARSRKSYVDGNLPLIDFTKLAPAVAAVRSDGQLIWVAGFDPYAGPQAVSGSWLVYALSPEPRAIGHVRIDMRGVEVVQIRGCSIYGIIQDNEGIQSVAVFEVPRDVCATTGAA